MTDTAYDRMEDLIDHELTATRGTDKWSQSDVEMRIWQIMNEDAELEEREGITAPRRLSYTEVVRIASRATDDDGIDGQDYDTVEEARGR